MGDRGSGPLWKITSYKLTLGHLPPPLPWKKFNPLDPWKSIVFSVIKSPALSRCPFKDVYVFGVPKNLTLRTLDLEAIWPEQKSCHVMVLTYFHMWSSLQENLSSGLRVRTAKALTRAGRSAHLLTLFTFWKASYLNLL